MCVGAYSVPVHLPEGLEPNPDEEMEIEVGWPVGELEGAGPNMIPHHPIFFPPSLKNEGCRFGARGHGGTGHYTVLSSQQCPGGRFDLICPRLAIGVRVCPVVCLITQIMWEGCIICAVVSEKTSALTVLCIDLRGVRLPLSRSKYHSD